MSEERTEQLWREIAQAAQHAQAQINAAGMGDSRDAELASLRAWKAEAETFMANSLETWDAQNKEIDRLKADRQALANNVERAINILTPLFVAYQEMGNPNEELLGGALDVLSGWFGQSGQPLRRISELESEITRLREFRTKVDRLVRRFSSEDVSPTPDQRTNG